MQLHRAHCTNKDCAVDGATELESFGQYGWGQTQNGNHVVILGSSNNANLQITSYEKKTKRETEDLVKKFRILLGS